MKHLSFLFVLIFTTTAEDLYIGQSASGSGDGSSCMNQLAYGFFNTSGNWGTGTGKISAGDTVHICGTITFTANTVGLTVQGNGAAGSPILIIFETGSILQAAYFQGYNVDAGCSSNCGGAINITGHTNIIVDGQNTGIVQNTADGTSLANQHGSTGVFVGGSSDSIIIRNLTIRTIYVNQGSSSGATDGGGYNTTGLTMAAASATSLKACNNHISSASVALLSATTATGHGYPTCASNSFTAGVYYFGNTISDSHWHVKLGGSGDVDVFNNDISDWTNWQYPTSLYHTDGIIIFGSTGLVISPWIYNNYIHGDLGTGSPTGFVFCTYGGAGSGSACTLFNNLFVGSGNTLNGDTMFWPHSADGNPLGPHRLYNNTFVNSGYQIGGDGDSTTVYDLRNNLFVGGPSQDTYFYSQQSEGNPFPNLTVNNNLYYNGRRFGPWNWWTTTATTLTEWRNACTVGSGIGCDSTASTANPNLDGSYQLTAGSPAIGLGANLSSLGITPLNTDKNGIARGSSWDAGCCQFQAPPIGSAHDGTSIGGSIQLGH